MCVNHNLAVTSNASIVSLVSDTSLTYFVNSHYLRLSVSDIHSSNLSITGILLGMNSTAHNSKHRKTQDLNLCNLTILKISVWLERYQPPKTFWFHHPVS